MHRDEEEGDTNHQKALDLLLNNLTHHPQAQPRHPITPPAPLLQRNGFPKPLKMIPRNVPTDIDADIEEGTLRSAWSPEGELPIMSLGSAARETFYGGHNTTEGILRRGLWHSLTAVGKSSCAFFVYFEENACLYY